MPRTRSQSKRHLSSAPLTAASFVSSFRGRAKSSAPKQEAVSTDSARDAPIDAEQPKKAHRGEVLIANAPVPQPTVKEEPTDGVKDEVALQTAEQTIAACSPLLIDPSPVQNTYKQEKQQQQQQEQQQVKEEGEDDSWFSYFLEEDDEAPTHMIDAPSSCSLPPVHEPIVDALPSQHTTGGAQCPLSEAMNRVEIDRDPPSVPMQTINSLSLPPPLLPSPLLQLPLPPPPTFPQPVKLTPRSLSHSPRGSSSQSDRKKYELIKHAVLTGKVFVAPQFRPSQQHAQRRCSVPSVPFVHTNQRVSLPLSICERIERNRQLALQKLRLARTASMSVAHT